MKLLDLFEKCESELRNELQSYRIPQDLNKLMSFLNDFFIDKVSVEEYKEDLSMTEVALFNSVIKMVSTPLSLVNEWTVLNLKDFPMRNEEEKQHRKKEHISLLQKINLPVIGSTTAGGIIGGLLFKTWGGVLLSIAGCALGMYFSSNNRNTEQDNSVIVTQSKGIQINVDKYIETLKQICKSIDEVMGSYHVSISNIEKTYHSTPKPTLATAYRPLLDRIASLYVALKTENLPTGVQSEFDKLYRTLKNHHYEILGYSDENKKYFIETLSPHVSEATIIKAAILENGELLEMGECLVPENF